MSYEDEVKSGQRFRFGKNWSRFLSVLDDVRIEEAVASLKKMLEVETLEGKSFLDVGSGSGLFSLAARRLGAKVTSFDFDPQSVECTEELKRRYFVDDPKWRVLSGSILDDDFVQSIGKFDIVYSWGVLHHTGQMWKALHNVDHYVQEKGRLFIAIYNDQKLATKYWTRVKAAYNKMPFLRPLIISVHLIYPTLPSILVQRLSHRKPPRGMTQWYDLLDWLGGFPFEVAKPEQIVRHYRERGYILTNMKTVGGRNGCNEFVFQRIQSPGVGARSSERKLAVNFEPAIAQV